MGRHARRFLPGIHLSDSFRRKLIRGLRLWEEPTMMADSAVFSSPPALHRMSHGAPAGSRRAGSAAEATVLPGAGPRRLAVVIMPCPGEAFVSWVDRLAASHQVPPGLAAGLLGVEVRHRRGDVRPVFYGLALTSASRSAVMAATGLQETVLHDMQMARYDGAALDLRGLDLSNEASLRRVLKREWMLVHGSRACPRCLADGPMWPTWWRLGIAAVCPVHGVLLVDTCPRCGIGLRRGYEHHPRGLSKVTMTDPRLCGNHTDHGRCAQPVAAIPTVPAAEEVVAAQETALRAADGQSVTVAGTTVAAAQWFQALKFLAAVFRFGAATVRLPDAGGATQAWADGFAAEYQRLRDDGRLNPGSLRAMPSSAQRAAGLLAAAHHVLGAVDRCACQQILAPVAEATLVVRRRLGGHNPLRRFPMPEPLASVLLELTPPASRVAGAIPTVDRPSGLRVRHLPQHIPAEDYRELLARHLPGTAEPTGRRLAALAAARVLGAPSWPEAARQLDMDPRKAARASDAVVRRIADVAAFWDAITDLVCRLGQQEMIDYRDRRCQLTNLYEVPASVLRPVCAQLGCPVTQARRRHAAAWIWEQFTGGDVRDAPAYQRDWTATAESVREGARRFATWLPEPVQSVLRGWGETLLTQKGSA